MLTHTCAQSYFTSTVRLAVFLAKLLYAVAYVPSLAHTRAHDGSLSHSISWRRVEDNAPCQCGDHPSGSQPNGMSKINMPASSRHYPPLIRTGELYHTIPEKGKCVYYISFPLCSLLVNFGVEILAIPPRRRTRSRRSPGGRGRAPRRGAWRRGSRPFS